MYVNCVVLT